MISKGQLMRLAALEKTIRGYEAPPPTDFKLTTSLISFHVGRWQPRESIIDGITRALGYDQSFELQRAIRENLSDFNERYRGAITKMFASKCVNLNDCTHDAFLDAFCALIEDAEKAGMRLPPFQ
jgi:hypothetical protein